MSRGIAIVEQFVRAPKPKSETKADEQRYRRDAPDFSGARRTRVSGWLDCDLTILTELRPFATLIHIAATPLQSPAQATQQTAPATRAQIAGVTLGNALEFYDFLVFSYFALQIGQTFFPDSNPQSSLLAALATFGAGFLTRPLGAYVIGGMADRIGRRPMMILSFTMIGAGSLGVALTPGYASIGMVGSIAVIFFRLLQGFALGGEVGASTAFLAETAPPERRGLYICLQFASQGVSMLVSGLVGVALASVLDDAALTSWGWRIAMGLGAAIVPFGLLLRRNLPETLHPAVSKIPPPPFAQYRRLTIFAFLTMLSGTIATYVLSYMTTYARTVLLLPSNVAFGATVAVGVGYTLGGLGAGLWSDRFGRRPVMILPMAIGAAGIIPGFLLLSNSPGPASLYTVSFVLRFLQSMATTAAFISVTEALPPRLRSGALAIIYAIATSVFGGTTQFVVAWLIGVTGNPLAPAWYMLAAVLVGLAATALSRETAPLRTKELTTMPSRPTASL